MDQQAWIELWRWLLYLGVGVFTMLSLYVIVFGFRDVLRLLEKD